jgi:hypothetical protein
MLGFMMMGVLVWWLSEVWYQNKDKTQELEAEPSSLSETFLGILDPEILTF